MIIYLVQHLHTLDQEREDIKVIGLFSSEKEALNAIDQLKDMPGFIDFPKIIDPLLDDDRNGFYIDAYQVDQSHWNEGFFTTV